MNLFTKQKQTHRHMMLKAQLLCTPVLNQVLETEFWVKQKKIALPGKGEHRGHLPQKTVCPNTGGFDEEFYDNTSQVWGC